MFIDFMTFLPIRASLSVKYQPLSLVHVVLVLVGLLALLPGCAPKRSFVAVPVPAWDLVEGMPLAPPPELSESERSDFEAGWRWLRRGNLQAAADELEGLGRRHPEEAAVATALGYLELRAGSYAAAERYFDSALRRAPRLAPASGGQVLVALARDDEEEAYRRVLELEDVDPTHELVDRYRTRLQVDVAESRLRAARAAFEQERFEEAADAYEHALEVAPEAGALYLEAAEAALAAGGLDAAVRLAERAAELEPMNATAHEVLAEALYRSDALERAVQSMRRAAELLSGDDDVAERLASLEAEYRERNLPEQYARISSTRRLTREELAALLYVELRDFFEATPGTRQPGIATDIPDSWASAYILPVVRAGILEVFPNYTFQPQAFVDRADLAGALASAFEQFAPEAYEAALRAIRSRESFPDLSRENVSFPAAALSVSLGWLDTGEGGAFEPRRLASGAEAERAVEALAADMTR